MPEHRKMKLTPVDIKLLILYLLQQAGQPLTAAQMTDLILADSLLDYFEAYHYIGALVEEGQIEEVENHAYRLTEAGEQAVEFFENRLPYTILEKIRNRTESFRRKIQWERMVNADYIPLIGEEYQVQLTLQEEETEPPFQLSFVVAGKETAKKICARWKEDYASLYGEILSIFSKN